jgi:hypothetical protein
MQNNIRPCGEVASIHVTETLIGAMSHSYILIKNQQVKRLKSHIGIEACSD